MAGDILWREDVIMDPTPGLIPAACWYTLFLQSLLRSARGVSYQLIVFNVTLIDIRPMLLSSSQTRSWLRWGINLPGPYHITFLPLLHSDTCDGTTNSTICFTCPSWKCHVLEIKESEWCHSILTDQSTPQECVLQAWQGGVWAISLQCYHFPFILSYFSNHKWKKVVLL